MLTRVRICHLCNDNVLIVQLLTDFGTYKTSVGSESLTC